MNKMETEIYGLWRLSIPDEYTQGAVKMLKLISDDMGFEESETYYYQKFIWNKMQ